MGEYVWTGFDYRGEPTPSLAIGNGDPTSHEPFIAEKRSAFNGKILIIMRSTKTTGTITLNARSKGLLNSSIKLKLIKYDLMPLK